MPNAPAHTIIRGGRLIDPLKRQAVAADILIRGDTIAEIGRPKMAAPGSATVIDGRDRLLHPGLINASTHSHGGLARGMGDRWTLALLITASPWISDPFLAASRDLARDHDVGLHAHVSESKVQVVAGYTLYGTSLTKHLDSLGT